MNNFTHRSHSRQVSFHTQEWLRGKPRLLICQIDWISGETDKTKAKPNQKSNQKCRFIQGNKQGEHLLKREKCEGSEKTVEM